MKTNISQTTPVTEVITGQKTSNSKNGTLEDTKAKQVLSAKMSIHEPVNYVLAVDCVNKYLAASPQTIKKTEYISFASAPLLAWITQLSSYTVFDELRVALGLYTLPILVAHGKDPRLEGRLTVFIFPYQNGSPSMGHKMTGDEVDPYNMGEIHP